MRPFRKRWVRIKRHADIIKENFMNEMQSNKAAQTHPFVIVVFWLYVGLPLAWGIASTLKTAMVLFQ